MYIDILNNKQLCYFALRLSNSFNYKIIFVVIELLHLYIKYTIYYIINLKFNQI